MHLSKVKHSKFNESGQLAIFYAVSAAWGVDLIIRVCYYNSELLSVILVSVIAIVVMTSHHDDINVA